MNYIDYEQLSAQRPKRSRDKPHFVRILVYDIASGDQIREHGVNFSKVMVDRDQKLTWLLNMMLWATKNGKSVEIISEQDWQNEESTYDQTSESENV